MTRVILQLAALLVTALPWAALAGPARLEPGAALSGPFLPFATLEKSTPLPGPPPGAPAQVTAPALAVPPRPRADAGTPLARPAPRQTARLYLSFASLQLDGG